MNILLLTDALDRGGVETHVELLARALHAHGEEVTVLSAKGKLVQGLVGSGIRHVTMPLPRHTLQSFLARRRILSRLLRSEHFDVLHAHTRQTALLLRTFCRTAPRIVTVHAKFSASPIERLLSYWGEYTLAVSEDLAEYTAAAYSIPRAEIHVIPNGIDLEKFAPHKRNGDKAVQILFASRLDRDCSQGAHLLLDITPRLIARGYRVHITIAGGGQEHSALSKRAEDINRALNLDVVTVSGHVEDMPSLLSRQDVFIGVSRAAMEAAACGCAVILCGNEGYLGIWNRWNHSQATRTNLCCRSAPLPTVEALEKDLCKLLEDPALRASAASEAHTLVRKQFDGNAMLAAHLDLYRAAKKGRRVLCIGGYFGCGNLGDDLILDGFLRGVKKQLPSLRIIALSKSAGEDSRHFGIRCVGRRSPLEILPTLSRADAFLCGGGSLLQNKTGNLSLLYYLSLLRLAKAMHATPILYAAGIGPLLGKRACQRAKHTLESSPYLSLRDPDSLSTLQSLGIPQERLHLGADATFLLPVPQKRERQGASYVCIVLKGNGTLPSPLVPCAKELSRRRAISPVLVLFDRVSDKEATKRAALYLGVPILSPTDATETLSILAGASLVLTERLHAMILSLSVGTPAIGIVHDPRDKKIPSFAQLSGQSCFVGKEITQEALIDAALQLLEHEEKLRPILSERASALRKKAEKDLEKILSLLYNDTM